MRSTTAQTAAAARSVLAVLLTPTTATAHTASSPGDTIALPVPHRVRADEVPYTRNEVLLEEAVTAPEQEASCRLTGGSWYSPYDDTYFTVARALDIDHLVPLAEAWDSGAST
ncbi:hypothetical protein QFZ22_000245 [Streptomyces canus]|uniref:DUF1524 domain-containing protein n=1 Tax=Streptomyces canus TaxID=58343 RepID=A0AAW8F4J8_9ACTN|nr:hypothetical protein [Streptomyces canus]